MYRLRIDTAKNRLYVNLEGFFALDEMKRCVDETIAISQKLKPGYSVVTDISLFKTASQEVAEEIGRAQKHFVKSGVKYGVRIVGKSVATSMQFKRTGGHVGYQSTDVSSVEEGDTLLDSQIGN